VTKTSATHNPDTSISAPKDTSNRRTLRRHDDDGPNKTRIQIDLSQERFEKFNQMMNDCNLDTKKDLFNNALTLLAWAIEELKAGNHIASYNKGTGDIETIHMPIFDGLKEQHRNAALVKATRMAR
jgi:hypothetical protein